jgi:hypothetical protein
MNNQEVGYIFAEKFNSESIDYGTGFNPLRGKGYSASVRDLVFEEQFYGDPRYGGAEYGGNSDGYYIRWMFTSSLTQSFYDANPGISPDENLYVLYQNYIPTGSGSGANDDKFIQYTTYIPLGTQNFTFPPATTNFNYNITGEYYSLATVDNPGLNPQILRIGTGSGEITTAGTPLGIITTPDISTTPSGSFNITASSSSPQIYFNIRGRYISTGSVFVLRNLKITYPVDTTIFEPFAQTQDLHLQTSAGMINARYEGCKMTSPDFNIDSPDTIDGGPVVTVTTVNPKSPVRGDTVPKQKISRSVKNTDSASSLTGKGNFKIK